MGSRLWEPRVLTAVNMVLYNEASVGHFDYVDDGTNQGYTAIGIKMTVKYDKPHFTYYSDGTDVPQVLVDRLEWETGFPDISLGDSCVVMRQKKLKNAPCNSVYTGCNNGHNL